MSDISTRKPKFGGSFFTYEVEVSTDREKGIKDVLLVFSSGKREAILEYLWLKFLWSQLTKDEFLLFILTLSPKDEKKWAFLRMLTFESKKTLRTRLNRIETIFGGTVSTKERLPGYFRLRIEILKETRRLPKVPKYSGYVKSPSSVGSKRPVRRFLDEMVANDKNIVEENEFSWFDLLRVDQVLLFQGQWVISVLKSFQ
jgi:hypothetical protein